MKVTVIGGGSTYTPELVQGFLQRVAEFPLSELCLMDIDLERLKIVGGFTQRMVQARGDPFKVTISTDQKEAIQGAGYVITQLRVGGMEARRKDEYLGLRHGLIGQETTGIGGMAKALRTIPVILEIARQIQALTPGALLVNFTNPSGLVTEAVTRYMPEVAVVGVCNVPITVKMAILDLLKADLDPSVDPDQVHLNTLGLNHLSWHRGLTVAGSEVWPLVMTRFKEEVARQHEEEWDLATLDAIQMIPNGYLRYYYYPERALAKQKKWPLSRAEEVQVIEKDLLLQYAQPDRSVPPEELMERGGAYYSTVATQLLNAHYNDLNEVHIVNRPHMGAVSGWPDDWVLEMPCKVTRSGFVPLPAEPLPAACFGLLAQVKSYELLTVEAAVHGDHKAAYQALLAHPLGPSADKITALWEDLLATHKDHLPQFKR